jgi:hypothetical protein
MKRVRSSGRRNRPKLRAGPGTGPFQPVTSLAVELYQGRLTVMDAVRDATGERLTPFRNGYFAFQAAFGAAPRAHVAITLSWDDPTSDYDLWVLEEDGWELARSEDVNPETGQAQERVNVTLQTCERFQVLVRNYAGDPGEDLTLSMAVDPDGDTGDQVVDSRRFLYLDGDRPGQTSMAHTQADAIPFRAWLSEERPTEGPEEVAAMSKTIRRPVALALCLGFAAAGIIFGYWLRGFMAIDGCLDAGGRWNYQYNFCERLITEEEAYPQFE